MKALFAAVATIALLMGSVPSYAQKIYSSEAEAKRYCRSPVVWLNLPTHIYHMQGTKNYGATKAGAFVCQAAADKAGDRPAMNGQ